MTAKVDMRRRVTVPAEPGQVLEVLENADGTITLAPVKAHERKGSVLEGLRPFTRAECEACWGAGSDTEHDEFVSHCAALPKGRPPAE
jgi:bifunctional DNA-binding transcriptional regulator/antitoxin component of YhaV-PrlF toxin-antitoxin module